jgi:hypothetical protein
MSYKKTGVFVFNPENKSGLKFQQEKRALSQI